MKLRKKVKNDANIEKMQYKGQSRFQDNFVQKTGSQHQQ